MARLRMLVVQILIRQYRWGETLADLSAIVWIEGSIHEQNKQICTPQ
jgi:hypothetical protein